MSLSTSAQPEIEVDGHLDRKEVTDDVCTVESTDLILQEVCVLDHGPCLILTNVREKVVLRRDESATILRPFEAQEVRNDNFEY